MTGPDPPTQFILYVIYGVHDWRWSRPRQDVDVILSMELCGYLREHEALHCHAEKCQVRYSYAMINYLLCMNPVNAEQ